MGPGGHTYASMSDRLACTVDNGNSDVLFHYKSSLKVGEAERFIISYNLLDSDEIPEDLLLDSLWLRIKNVEPMSYRAAYLMGPFILYCDVRTESYHHSQKIVMSADQPLYEPNLQAQQSKVAELSLHTIQKKYVWIVDVVSQILLATNTSVSFELSIGKNKKSVDRSYIDVLPALFCHSKKLQVTKLTTLDMWKLPPQLALKKYRSKPKHLVILTHGLHSNVTTDLAYIQEQLYKSQNKFNNEQIIVEGYPGNVCQTEKGVKYLGTRVAEYIVKKLYDKGVTKISFIGHSLGGLIQTFAIAYIAVKYPWFFQKVEPINFITIASPLLGIVTDNPAYIKLLLSFGVIGKTGQDLSLENISSEEKPLLYLLPGEPVKNILSKFKRRTTYANVVNDGIVPLYTASLLFLNYDSILLSLRKLVDLNKSSENVTISENTAFFNRNFVTPLNKMIAKWAPQKYSENDSHIPKTSIFQSATSVLIPPLPDKAYIMDPNSRKSVIIHDRIYTEEDIPGKRHDTEDSLFSSENILLQAFLIDKREKKKAQLLEESIARRWHEGLSWRKVVVALEPDAHNNIIVRRRFANAYGWPVIDHLINEHFFGDSSDITTEAKTIVNTIGEVQNMQLELSNNHEWITRVVESSMFDEGPTGMISTMSEMFESFTKKQFSNSQPSDPNDEVAKFEEENFDLIQ